MQLLLLVQHDHIICSNSNKVQEEHVAIQDANEDLPKKKYGRRPAPSTDHLDCTRCLRRKP